MEKLFFIAVMMVAAFANGNPVDNLQPGCWYAAPNTPMSAVDPCPANNCSYSGSTGQATVLDGWGGGAFDTKRNCFIAFGGGHSNYCGNEVYTFSVDSLKWYRLTEPTGPGPVSVHSYDGLVYVPAPVDRFFTYGGSSCPTGGGTSQTYLFNFDTKTWASQANPGGGALGAVCAYDSATGKVIVMGSINYNSIITSFTPNSSNGTWTNLGNGYPAMYQTGAVDTKRHRLIVVGGGQYGNPETHSYNLSASGAPWTKLTTTGATEIERAPAPGLAYVSSIDKFVAWGAGRPQDVYLLDPATNVWTCVQPSANNTVIPPSPVQSGTYGKFQYIPSKNAFVCVTTNKNNVYFYKLPSGVLAESNPNSSLSSRLKITPNPFNSFTTISFGNSNQKGLLNIYDMAGKLVKSLGNTRSGQLPMVWNGKDVAGHPLSSGVYVVSVSDGVRNLKQKVVLSK